MLSRAKMWINAFSLGIRFAKGLMQHISATKQDIGLVSKDHIIGNHVLRVQRSRDQRRHVTPKRQGHDPDIFEARYLDILVK